MSSSEPEAKVNFNGGGFGGDVGNRCRELWVSAEPYRTGSSLLATGAAAGTVPGVRRTRYVLYNQKKEGRYDHL